MSEHGEQAAFFEYCAYRQGEYPCLKWMHAIPNGGLRDKKNAAIMSREGVKRGIFDVFLPYATKRGYHGLYIEFKFGKNKLTAEQKEFVAYVESAGYKTAVAYSAEEAIEVLEEYLRGE